jgi:hypothetical protein
MEIYKCEICNYTTNIKSNLTRHIKGKHTEKVEPIDDKQREIERLKAEIELLKSNHKTELMALELSIYKNQIIRPSRKSISPTKPEPEPDVIPKKRHNENTLDYLNKHYPPLEQENDLLTVLGEKLLWQDIELSTINIENQYVSILRPLIEKYKMIYSSGDKCHTPKLYYIIENEWREMLDNLEYVCYYIYIHKISIAIEEGINTKKFNSVEHDELSNHYAQRQSQSNIVKQLLDVMKLPIE